MCDIQVFQAVKDVGAHDPLVGLLESIGSFMKHLDIYTKIRPTVAMTEIVVKTLGELLFILAMATNFIKQGKPGEFLLAEILPDSMYRREICREAFRKEGCRRCTPKAGSTHPG